VAFHNLKALLAQQLNHSSRIGDLRLDAGTSGAKPMLLSKSVDVVV
jgi:hypothetical protein